MVSSLLVRFAAAFRPFPQVVPDCHSGVRRRPFRNQLRSPNYLALEVHREVIDDLDQPGLRVPRRIQFDQSDEKRLLNDVTSVLLLEPVFPRRPANEREKVLSIELVETLRVGRKGGAGGCPGHDLLPLLLHNSRFVARSQYLYCRDEERNGSGRENPSAGDENGTTNLPEGEP